MPIQKLDPPIPSSHQLNKAKRCVVTLHELGHWVWDPAVNSEHLVFLSSLCDCFGFQSHGFCSHIVAVQLYKERQKDRTADQAISELYDL